MRDLSYDGLFRELEALRKRVESLETKELTATIAADAVANTQLANMVQATIKGRASGAGTGDPTDLTAAQVAAIVNSSLSHLSLTNIGSNSHAAIDAHLSSTASHGASGAVVGTTNTQQLDNPLLLATGSAVYPATNGYLNGSTNANIAAAWELLTSGAPSVTPTLVARTDGMGNSQRLSITSTTGSDQTNYRNRSSIAGRFSAGDVIRGQVKLSISSASALTGIKVWWAVTVGGTTTYSLHAINSSLYTFDQTNFTDFVFTTPDFVVPTGALTSSYFTIRTTYSGAGGCTLDISQPTLRKLT